MTRQNREWHPKFLEYMEFIVRHENYRGLPIEKNRDGSYKWIVTAKTDTGKKRIKWCEDKARELGIPIQAGVYADVMLAIHPTKTKVCQTCGKTMSLYYHYPNAALLKSLNKRFGISFSADQHISSVWDELLESGYDHREIAEFLISKGGLNNVSPASTKDDIIEALEFACRKGNKGFLGPGAMSNFPDRFDGFHTYNRCCRAVQDKGRSKENLKSYTKDRRAYEYWSDGNIHAANQFMGSKYFKGISADHVGPISLGFIHDPHYLQPMPSGENSSKRDRLQIVDIEKILEIERKTGIYPMSWYSREIWDFIVANYKRHPEYVGTKYRDALKQNMANFMYILWHIAENCTNGRDFLVNAFLCSKFASFDYSYKFDPQGNIVMPHLRHFTDRRKGEVERYARIAMESVYDYNSKENRNTANDLTSEEHQQLSRICCMISDGYSVSACKEGVQKLIHAIARREVAGL